MMGLSVKAFKTSALLAIISCSTIGFAKVSDVRSLVKEKSWQLALEQIEKDKDGALSEADKRERLYLKGLSLSELRRTSQAADCFTSLTLNNIRDQWAGLAYERLQPGLAPMTYLDTETTNPLQNLQNAESILTEISYTELPQFYDRVINSSLFPRHYPREEERKYLLSFIDRATEIVRDDTEKLAHYVFIRENFLDAQTARSNDDRINGLRTIVKEFPKTAAALRAQNEIAGIYYGTEDYVAAVYEFSLLISNYPTSSEAESAKKLIETIKSPGVTLQVNSMVLPGERLTIPIAVRNTGGVKIIATPFNPVDQLKQKKEDLDLDSVKGNAAFTKDIEIPLRDDYKATTQSVDITLNSPGAYVLRAETSDQKAYATSLVIVSDLTLLSNNSNGTLEFWAVDTITGTPRPNTEVNVFWKTGKTGLTGRPVPGFDASASVITDENGFADSQPETGGEVFVIAKENDNFALIGSTYVGGRYVPDSRNVHNYIYTDRPVYRPEQEVFWRAVLRESKDGDFVMPSQTKYNVNIYDSRNQLVKEEKELSLSSYGTLSGSLKIPVGAPLGNYRIEIRSADQPDYSYGNRSFRVEEYKKPEFEVSVDSLQDFAKINDQIEAEINAQYLFGGAVQDADISYTVKRRPRYWLLRDNISWSIEKDYDWFNDTAAGSNVSSRRPSTLHGSGGDIVSSGIGKLDSDGKFVLKFKAEVPEHELNRAQRRPDVLDRGGFNRMIWPPVNPTVWDFQIEVTVTDKSRRNIDASSIIPVGLKALQVEGKTERTILMPGDRARAELKAFNLAKKPVAVSGTVHIEKVVYNETVKEDQISTLTSYALDIGTSGSAVTEWRVPEDVEGMLRFAFECEDPFGGKSITYVPFTVASPNTKELFVRYAGVQIIADKSKYEVGETARLIVLNEFPNSVAWYWIYAESGNLEKRVIPLPNRTNFINIPITDSFAPNSMVNLALVHNKMVYRDNLELVVPPTRKTLTVDLIPGEEKLTPGVESKVKIRVKDFEGKPVQGEFSLSIFDKAITYIAPDSREDIRKSFYGKRRNVRQNVQESIRVDGRYGRVFPEDSSYMLNRYLGYAEVSSQMMFKENMLESGAMRARAAAAPASAMGAAPVAMEAAANFDSAQPESAAPVEVRADFRDSVYWKADIVTDENGEAEITMKMPDSLTTWEMVSVGIDAQNRVGNDNANVITSKDVIARLEVPRFFRERDTLTVSGIVHNYGKEDLKVNVKLEAEGVEVVGGNSPVEIKAGGEVRVNYNVRVKDATTDSATLRFVAQGSTASDALARTVPVVPHGIDKFVAWNGSLADETTAGITLTEADGKVTVSRTVSIPKDRIPATTRLTVDVSPGMARLLKNALPYMIDYPYGCVEQTMNRFVPAAVAIGAFRNLNIPVPPDVAQRIPDVTKTGLQRIADMQQSSGGWGWWHQDQENLYMTAYIMKGLTQARQADIGVDDTMFSRGLSRLEQLSKDNLEILKKQTSREFSYFRGSSLNSLALAQFVLVQNGKAHGESIDLIWERRDQLGNNALALFAQTLWKAGRQDDARVVLRNMYNFAVITPENDTARWGLLERGWYWWDNPVESTASGLQAFLEIAPEDPMVEKAVKWLVLNRSGAQWKSTKDTAEAVSALTRYMILRGERQSAMNMEVKIGNALTKKLVVDSKNFWDFNGKILLEGNDVPEGEFSVSVTSDNTKTPVYYSVYAEYFTTEENIPAAGNEIFVEREYAKLVRETVKNSQGKEEIKDNYVALKPGEKIVSGDEIRVRMKIKSLNDYEYIMIEDHKAAGTEAVDINSGFRCSGGLCGHMEMRDQKTVFFFTHLPQGEHVLEYNVRAEIPGEFHAMPTLGSAMYFPILRTNSAENIVTIMDKQ